MKSGFTSALGLYGVILTMAGVYQWFHLPATLLANRHATFWAGVALLAIGGIYTFVYWPARGKADPHDGSRVE